MLTVYYLYLSQSRPLHTSRAGSCTHHDGGTCIAAAEADHLVAATARARPSSLLNEVQDLTEKPIVRRSRHGPQGVPSFPSAAVIGTFTPPHAPTDTGMVQESNGRAVVLTHSRRRPICTLFSVGRFDDLSAPAVARGSLNMVRVHGAVSRCPENALDPPQVLRFSDLVNRHGVSGFQMSGPERDDDTVARAQPMPYSREIHDAPAYAATGPRPRKLARDITDEASSARASAFSFVV
ncbi:hypothetical protein EVG20_g11002 [Dentipellis fragilis]|uniref:Uncharacterized protein n=1 Tax=Dentipellis fragilis TaxID=205917 RepID=A0A4Y9XNV0_9AGAM|nr:hypothetical protein EVG20_g11002 [Dentipellis fragilis]